ncbi:MAG TPA: GNAT family N-acetyltransferase [Prolixibacteraceae bacterium]|nr:GNAT family N-acetyltransferase [Prolixibacteraceae bacterium]
MEKRLEALPWDSSLFGYPVAKALADPFQRHEMEELLETIRNEKIRLTYLFCPPLSEEMHRAILTLGFRFVDEKRTYSKNTEMHPSSCKIRTYQEPLTESMIALSLQSGIFSRFATDPGFQNREYEKLYTEWIRRSVSGEIAISTLVAESDLQTAGLITLGEKNGHAEIGLLAVEERFRGEKIGSELIKAADSLACESGFNQIDVVTQGQNQPACRLYEKMNFTLSRTVFVYHYWNHEQ